ncbi:hypothetical protein IE81DRAFT_23753 [Ceraceosorus guamensis]|uniref:Uncharacterized protein n=1 Tax=Ceraceosorus guamensis TaxID=1522189 RepID=A0A316VTG3_9BASI|nr:hypothetical protein IE81DRAFT_23753 [Ceraceosorus guamensis]PWN39501.1 hypothetical protein IE81DRAFT_23753 [Ceraceosorus guamensis]
MQQRLSLLAKACRRGPIHEKRCIILGDGARSLLWAFFALARISLWAVSLPLSHAAATDGPRGRSSEVIRPSYRATRLFADALSLHPFSSSASCCSAPITRPRMSVDLDQKSCVQIQKRMVDAWLPETKKKRFVIVVIACWAEATRATRRIRVT